MEPIVGGIERTRTILHRVAAHVLARRRWEVTGRFGLRLGPGGIATPSFGDEVESVRISGALLVHESGGTARYTPIRGSSVRRLAHFAGAEIDGPFSCGDDTPELGDPDEPLDVSARDAGTIAQWYELGWRVLDTVLGTLPASANAAALQLWPEHFDIGTNVGLPDDQRVNLGCSPGDRYVDEPYLYVGPRGSERPGDPGYWNEPFGAVLRFSDLASSGHPAEVGVQFMSTGLGMLSSPVSTN